MRDTPLDAGRSAHTRHSARSREKGISLLEVVVTISILAVIALSATLVLVPISRQTRINKDLLNAEAEATRRMEHIQSLPFEDIQAHYPPGSKHDVESLEHGQLAVVYADPEADPLEITLTLTWSSPDLEDMEKIFTTARTK